jgi:hypothetical protein
MQIEFTPQEKRHFITMMDDVLEHEQLKPNREFRKQANWYKNKFMGEGLVNLKVKHIAELYNLTASSLGVLNRMRKSESLPAESKPEVINYIVIVSQLLQKLQDIALSSGRLAMNEPTKLPE